MGNSYEKELQLSKLKMSYYPEQDSHIRDKVKVRIFRTCKKLKRSIGKMLEN